MKRLEVVCLHEHLTAHAESWLTTTQQVSPHYILWNMCRRLSRSTLVVIQMRIVQNKYLDHLLKQVRVCREEVRPW